MHTLVVTDSVHATAAACDYLEDRLTPEDAVTVVAVAVADPDTRDAGDATNVATARLTGHVDLETVRITAEGDDQLPGAVLEAVTDHDVDEVLLDAGLVGSADERVSDAITRIIGRTSVPVVVVPRQA